MTNQDFDRLVNSIREDVPKDEAVVAAADRVREGLRAGYSHQLVAQFRADFEAYRGGRLAEGRRMLIEDHLHSCVPCRREYSGVRNTPVIPISSSTALTRRTAWAAAAAVLIGAL